jgi:hypothetical protein
VVRPLLAETLFAFRGDVLAATLERAAARLADFLFFVAMAISHAIR